jgi:hypothetical protein
MLEFVREKFIVLGQFLGGSDFKLPNTQSFDKHVLTADPEAEIHQFNNLVCSPSFITGSREDIGFIPGIRGLLT